MTATKRERQHPPSKQASKEEARRREEKQENSCEGERGRRVEQSSATNTRR